MKELPPEMYFRNKKYLTYQLWSDMYKRVTYGTAGHRYLNCSIHPDFMDYRKFVDWCHAQIGFGKPRFCLDKDVLVKGNTLYGPDTCCFIPYKINSSLTMCNAARGSLPIGVRASGSKFKANIKIRRKSYYFGPFETVVEAFNAYKAARENAIREMAEEHKHEISERAYQALMNFKIEITD